jgi:hypothetical protein
MMDVQVAGADVEANSSPPSVGLPSGVAVKEEDRDDKQGELGLELHVEDETGLFGVITQDRWSPELWNGILIA